jgi:DNA-binding MarR family transcriptional regulator
MAIKTVISNHPAAAQSDENRHSTAFDIPHKCTSLNLRRAARAASQFLENYLQPLGLHSSQFGILNCVSRFGSITMTSLAEEMSLDRTTVTRNLQIMERDGMVEVFEGKDRRVREIALTDYGKEVLSRAIPLWQQAEADLDALLTEEQRKAILTIVSAVSFATP